MRRLLAVGIGLPLCTAIARAGDSGSGSRSELTVGPDPFRSGNQVVRDRATGEPLYRVRPDPFRPGQQRIDDYNTGQPLGEVRPDPFNPDQSVIDDR